MPNPNNILVKQLDLELNGGCNYRCQMCPQAMGREKGFLKKLPFPVFGKIIDDALQYGLEAVSLHGSGEPTMNKDMHEMVRYVKDRGLKCISFTNGYKLTEDLSRRLIAAKLDILRVSAIGYDRESYHKWMSKDAFQMVRDNVRCFVDLNREMGGQTELHLYHLVTDINEKEREVAAYRENWIDYTGGSAEIWLMHNWSGGYGAPYKRDQITGKPVKRSCGRPFSPLLQVRAGGLEKHNGAVVACCMTLGKDNEAVLGHLDTQSIEEVVRGSAYANLQAAHREGRFDDISYCKDCDQLYDLEEALVWTNIPGRAYGESKVAAGVDHRVFLNEGPNFGL